jgi:hypothetical protein
MGILNILTISVLMVCVRRISEAHKVEVQARALGLVVIHRTTAGDFNSIVEIVEAEGEKKNLEEMGLIFSDGKVFNSGGDKFELVLRLSDGQLLVHPYGETFSWP